jgi:DNA-binding LacI/PurR family transcriptional regulator
VERLGVLYIGFCLRQAKEFRVSITIKELSKECKVSIATVSQVLNGIGRSREDTRQRILETAQKLGYRPNRYAKAMQSGKFGSVSLLLSSEVGRSNIPQELFNGIVDYLTEHNVHLCVTKLPDIKLSDDHEMPKILTEWMCDGLIINYNIRIPEAMAGIVRETKIPSIWVNVDSFDCDSVYYDEYDAGVQATNRFLSLGHSRIAFCDLVTVWDKDTHYSSTARRHGYIDTMTKAGLQPRCIGGVSKLTREQRISYARDILCRQDRPSAIVACCATSGIALLIAAASLQIQFPKDISISTFAETAFLSGMSNFFTAYVLPEYEAGREAARMVLSKIEHPEVDLPNTVLKLNFAPGATVGAPASQT